MDRKLSLAQLEDELMGFAEIHSLYNQIRGRDVTPAAVQQKMDRQGAPEPFKVLGCGNIYLRSEVEPYLRQATKPGPKPKSR